MIIWWQPPGGNSYYPQSRKEGEAQRSHTAKKCLNPRQTGSRHCELSHSIELDHFEEALEGTGTRSQGLDWHPHSRTMWLVRASRKGGGGQNQRRMKEAQRDNSGSPVGRTLPHRGRGRRKGTRLGNRAPLWSHNSEDQESKIHGNK